MDLEVRHIPMKDHLPPDGASLGEAAKFLEQSLGAERVVLVHCLAGEGRTGCALAAYVMLRKGETAKEAIEDLRRIKPQFIERGQEAALYDLERLTGGAPGGPTESE